MRKTLMLLMTLLVCALSAIQCKKAPAPLTGIVDFVAGAVRISTAGNSAPAKVGDVIREGMTISTSERSFARVSFGENIIKIYELTELSFPSLSRSPGSGAEKTEMRMERGTILSDVALKLAKGDSHRVISDTMIAAVRGTEYLYSVDGASGLVACYRGSLSVLRAGSDEEVVINAGEMVSVREGKPMKAVKIPAGFRHRDFEYGRDPSYGQASGAGVQQKEEAGGAGSALKEERAVVKKTTASSVPAESKKQAQAAGTAAAGAQKKQAQKAVVKPAVAPASAAKKESAAEKEKSGASTTMAATSKTAAAEEKKPDAAAAGQKQPDALLEKPRVGLPEVK